MVTIPFEKKIAVFGDPRPFVRSDGTATEEWVRRTLGRAVLPAPLPLSWDRSRMVGTFLCHRLLVERFEAALDRVHANPAVWATVNDFGGCYAFRVMRGIRDTLSAHAWGIAIDLDVCDNPMGAMPRVHPDVIDAFEGEGFAWGGRFPGRRRDGMHFEFVDVSRVVAG